MPFWPSLQAGDVAVVDGLASSMTPRARGPLPAMMRALDASIAVACWRSKALDRNAYLSGRNIPQDRGAAGSRVERLQRAAPQQVDFYEGRVRVPV
jgi:hypothetical protein